MWLDTNASDGTRQRRVVFEDHCVRLLRMPSFTAQRSPNTCRKNGGSMSDRARKLLSTLFAFALTVGLPAFAHAQATVRGRVTTQEGQALPQARVLLVGTTISAVTD